MLTPACRSEPLQKCAAVVGEVLGKYHPHGDAAVYDTLVRMAQPWVMRYPLIDGQGNFGSVDGDPPAAYRYTEARMTAVAMSLVETSRRIRSTLARTSRTSPASRTVGDAVAASQPAGQRRDGIAVGMATKSRRTTSARSAMPGSGIDDPKTTSEELMEIVKGPDFPTGGIIYDARHPRRLRHRPRHGSSCAPRSTSKSRTGASHRHRRAPVPGEQVAPDRGYRRARPRQKLDGIADLRDETGREEKVRIVIELKYDAAAHGPEPPLQAHPAADDLRGVDAGDRRRPSAGAEPQSDAPALHHAPPATWSRGGRSTT